MSSVLQGEHDAVGDEHEDGQSGHLDGCERYGHEEGQSTATEDPRAGNNNNIFAISTK